jgi:hypothetical protein
MAGFGLKDENLLTDVNNKLVAWLELQRFADLSWDDDLVFRG